MCLKMSPGTTLVHKLAWTLSPVSVMEVHPPLTGPRSRALSYGRKQTQHRLCRQVQASRLRTLLQSFDREHWGFVAIVSLKKFDLSYNNTVRKN